MELGGGGRGRRDHCGRRHRCGCRGWEGGDRQNRMSGGERRRPRIGLDQLNLEPFPFQLKLDKVAVGDQIDQFQNFLVQGRPPVSATLNACPADLAAGHRLRTLLDAGPGPCRSLAELAQLAFEPPGGLLQLVARPSGPGLWIQYETQIVLGSHGAQQRLGFLTPENQLLRHTMIQGASRGHCGLDERSTLCRDLFEVDAGADGNLRDGNPVDADHGGALCFLYPSYQSLQDFLKHIIPSGYRSTSAAALESPDAEPWSPPPGPLIPRSPRARALYPALHARPRGPGSRRFARAHPGYRDRRGACSHKRPRHDPPVPVLDRSPQGCWWRGHPRTLEPPRGG